MNSDPQSPGTDGYDPVDTSKASVARAYDFVLGGKDNFEADRQFVEKMLERDPEAGVSARLNKDFGRRVVDYIAGRQVGQFLDLGSGIPTSPPSVHDTARRINNDTRVVYVDHDPVVVAHNRALRANGPGLAVIQESFADLDQVFSHPQFQSNIDVSQPVGVLLLSVLQNYSDEQVIGIMTELRNRLVPGSFVAISHISSRTSAAFLEAVAEEIAAGRYPPTEFRGDGQLETFLSGFELVEPGIVDFRDWRPGNDLEDNRPDLNLQFSCGVARFM